MDEHVYNLYLMSYTGLRGTSAKSPQSTGKIRGVSIYSQQSLSQFRQKHFDGRLNE